MVDQLKGQLSGDELISWPAKAPAPATDFDVLIAMGPVTGEMLASQPRLGLVQVASDGYDAVDLEAATEAGVWVSYTPGDVSGNADSVAEYAVMLLIATCRRLGEQLSFVRDHAEPRPLLNPALVNQEVCLYGLGVIGKMIAERLKPFGVRLSAVDTHPEHAPSDIQTHAVSDRDGALASADAVILCVRGSAENRHLADASFFAAMKKGSVLINIARGSLVDETALLNAVQSGHVAAAGLDVLEEEPVQATNPLLTLPQVLVTPHVAGFTDLTLEGTSRYVLKALGQFRAGEKLVSLVNAPPSPRVALR